MSFFPFIDPRLIWSRYFFFRLQNQERHLHFPQQLRSKHVYWSVDRARRIHAWQIRPEWKVTEARTLPAIRWRSTILHGLQTGAISELRHSSYVAEELYDNTREERELHNSHRKPSPAWDDLQISIWTTVGPRRRSERWPWRKGLTRRLRLLRRSFNERDFNDRATIMDRWSTIKKELQGNLGGISWREASDLFFFLLDKAL